MNKLLFFATFFCSFFNAQSIIWQKNLGGSGDEFGYVVRTTSDGGYIVGGNTSSSADGDMTGTNKGGNDIWIVKLDDSGAISWQKNYGGSGNDNIYDLQKTSDGGYIFAGVTTSSANGDVTGTNKGLNDLWVVKLTATGAISWQKNYGGSQSENAYAIQQTTDGGYILSGITGSSVSGDVTGANKGGSDIWLLKLTSTGTISWQKNYGGSANEYGYSVKQTTDGGYIVCGLTGSSASGDVSGTNKGLTDVWVLKLTSTGTISWQKNYGGASSESSFEIQQTTDGGYVLCGISRSSASGDISGINNGSDDAWIVKLSSTGTISWEKSFGGTGGEYAYSIKQTTGGGYIVAGYTSSSASGDIFGISNGGNDAWIFYLNSTGGLIWEKNFGGDNLELARSIQETSDGSFIFAGLTASSANGDISGVSNGLQDLWIVKLGLASLGSTQLTKIPIIIYPNPASNFFSINGLKQKTKIEVVDMTGKVVLATSITNGSSINTEHLCKGVYFVKINGQILKLIKQ